MEKDAAASTQLATAMGKVTEALEAAMPVASIRRSRTSRPSLPRLALDGADTSSALAEEDSVARVITQRRLLVNTLPSPPVRNPSGTAEISLENLATNKPSCWLRNTVKRKRGRHRLALFGQRAGPHFELFNAWNRCVLTAKPSIGPLGTLSFLIHQPSGDGQEFVGVLQGNHAQNIFLLVVPVAADSANGPCDPNVDPVQGAIAIDRHADGQRHLVALLPGMQASSIDLGKGRHTCDLGHADAVEALLHTALRGETMPSVIRVLRSRSATCMRSDGKDPDIKALDFQGRVTCASSKNFQLECESRPRVWPRLRMLDSDTTTKHSTPSTSSSTSEALVFQCGRTGADSFIADHNDHQMTTIQAFAIALSVLGWRAHYFWM